MTGVAVAGATDYLAAVATTALSTRLPLSRRSAGDPLANIAGAHDTNAAAACLERAGADAILVAAWAGCPKTKVIKDLMINLKLVVSVTKGKRNHLDLPRSPSAREDAQLLGLDTRPPIEVCELTRYARGPGQGLAVVGGDCLSGSPGSDGRGDPSTINASRT